MKKLSSILGAVAVLAAVSASIASAQSTYVAPTDSQTTQVAVPVDVTTGTSVSTPASTPTTSDGATLTGELSLGSSGQDVTNLQTLLATNSTIYPEGLVTGFYGPDTEAAVMRFQEAYGISPVGSVGPTTLAEVNSLISAGGGLTGANLNNVTTGSTASVTGVTTTTTTTTAPTFISTGMPAITNVTVQPFATSTDMNGQPTASGTESVMVSWNVNEPSQSSVFYLNQSNTTALGQSAATASTGFTTDAQSTVLTGLTPNTTYTFLIAASDASGNAGITYPSTFTVNGSGDTTSTINSSPNLNAPN